MPDSAVFIDGVWEGYEYLYAEIESEDVSKVEKVLSDVGGDVEDILDFDVLHKEGLITKAREIWL